MDRAKTFLCYTVNRHYALPTVLSAAQARANLDADVADVAILYVGNDDMVGPCRSVCERHGIALQVIEQAELEGEPVNLVRHMLHKFVPTEYADVVHVDGDTQVEGRLEPFVTAPLGTGRILAVPDPMAVMAGRSGKTWEAQRDYFRSIGIDDRRAKRYVNTGIFRLARSDLEAVGKECRRLCGQGRGFVYSEQDALNLAFGTDIALASFRWNYPAFFGNFDYGAIVAPRLRHYMSNPRPWQGTFLPWGEAGHRMYREFVANNPELASLFRPMRGLRSARYALQQRFKWLVEPPVWNVRPVKDRVAEMEASAVV